MDDNGSKLVLRDVPIFLWLFGLVFAGIGAVILMENAVPIMGLIFVVIGLAALLFKSVLTITADRTTRTLKLEYRSAVRYKFKEFSFDEIAGINVERRVSHNKGGVSYTYHVVMKQKDGKIVPFRTSSSSGSGKKERIAARLREFIGVQTFDTSPAGVFYAALQLQPGESHETNGVHWQVEPLVLGESTGTRWCSPDFRTQNRFLLVAQKAAGQSSQGFMASLGSMIFKHTLSMFGFRPEDIPGLDQAVTLAPLDPALETHFMAFTNAPDWARQILIPGVVKPLADWAGRYTLKQFQKASNLNQLVVLFGPNGVCLATMTMLQRDKLDEMAVLGVELVKSQISRQSAF